ncbi:MAG: hypothetical protein D6732_28765 [Methanobacteriota archaeon]|nr:MAG: hypothetical protein D6732_28765 [Euryarchaeota archaeon]
MRLVKILLFIGLIFGMLQPGFSKAGFGVNGEVALPMGTFGDVAGAGFGGTLLVQFPASLDLMFTGRAGYISWGGKELDMEIFSFSYNYSAIPVMGGVRKYFGTGGARFFAEGEVGLHIFKLKTTTTTTILDPVSGTEETTSTSASATETKFSVAPGVGVEFGSSTKMTISARYNVGGESYLGLRFGVAFGGAE